MIKRQLEAYILKTAKYFPVIAIVGPRQSGKTTLAKALFPNHTYLSLEDPDARAGAARDPRTFLSANKNKHGIIIDEFQQVPELLSYIQTMVDHEQQQGYFVLTGSQNFLMKESITQSLAGRVAIHTLLPLSVPELAKHKLLPQEIEPMLHQGSYPAFYAKQMDEPSMLYTNYLQTYLERDVRQLTHVGDLTTFQQFIQLCVARIGQLVNLSSLSNACGISDTTAKRWLSILQSSYIIFLLQPHHNNLGKRIVKTPKLYFYDTGLACQLLNITQQSLATHPLRGNLFESFVITEIYKSYFNRGQIPPVYFWRDKVGHEIDGIIDKGGVLTGIEVKSSRTVNQRFFDNITYWKKLKGNDKASACIVYAGSKEQPRINPDIFSWQEVDAVLELDAE